MVIRAHSDVLLLVHVVFAVANRRPLLPAAIDETLAAELRTTTFRHGGECLGVGNAADHVHLVVQLDPAVPLSQLVQRVKGASSYAINRRFPLLRLRWQSGYWAQSVALAGLGNLVAYVNDQRVRHASGNTDAAREQNPSTIAVEFEPL